MVRRGNVEELFDLRVEKIQQPLINSLKTQWLVLKIFLENDVLQRWTDYPLLDQYLRVPDLVESNVDLKTSHQLLGFTVLYTSHQQLGEVLH